MRVPSDAPPQALTIYWTPSLPDRWIAGTGAGLVAFPALAGGWAQKRSYRGYRSSLRSVDVETQRLVRESAGIPDSVPAC